jgi:hypothetical protein
LWLITISSYFELRGLRISCGSVGLSSKLELEFKFTPHFSSF